ncbi:uncharacterized protein Z519_07950 [Cladophialophora bantiana CBS 173.52]|uniref:F-box domain-containing protein n=1 Tax=Cladophialophora bantiana (strain ATCC 10958 / CBS 173.52 / CDC B-1940 / NIH 8579) TaxID=1442370 RepID=A0A0D2EM46_CLAB1|nr:uncharacterized protein Z519_07950 [Cladophialophora bantiana CBS 173.52]KIW91056.1 hypothetical protein Z519_07950 [Cladophialophora bantiana CBS 173.52]
MQVLDLPREILAHILACLHPAAIACFGQTCKAAHDFVRPQHQMLWRTAFLHIFDDPNDAWSMMPGHQLLVPDRAWDWHQELCARLMALRGVQSKRCGSDSCAEAYLSALLDILDTAKFAPNARDIANGKMPEEDDRTTSLNLQILSGLTAYRDGIESLIHDSGTQKVLPHARSDERVSGGTLRFTKSMALSENDRNRPESASRLHVLYGLTSRERIEHKARGAARRKVYNWSLSGPDNDYGPFRRDGTGKVDWLLLEAVFSVMSRNFSMCAEGRIAMPQGFCYALPHRTLADPTIPHDWARVTGTWLGTYSWLDYLDLFAFNNFNRDSGAHPTLDDEPEDSGDLMRLELKLDDVVASDPRLTTTLPVCTDLPVLYFSGLSRGHVGIHRPVIGVRGCASLVPGGREVRWRFIIYYGGQDQWQLEGVQPGGIRSGGVFGLWTQCDHEENGPVGPFCYFPAELCKPTTVVLAT